MNTLQTILKILDRELNLKGRALEYTADTKLRGALPQLDSMAIVSLVAALEEELGFEFPEDQLDGAVFETAGTLTDCVQRLLATDNV